METTIIIALLIVLIVLSALNLMKKTGVSQKTLHDELGAVQNALERSATAQGKAELDSVERMSKALSDAMGNQAALQAQQFSQLQTSVHNQLELFRKVTSDQMQASDASIRNLASSNEQKLEQIRTAVSESMQLMREENAKKLEEIRGTVNEKLQTTLEKRISESFKAVSDQLEQVYKGLGEMQTLASDVGGLKKVLSGVKTRGILGEIQLGAILEEILAPEQYETNVATVPKSSDRVEFAIRLPGSEEKPVYLPIDSKFPGERYAQLLDAQDSGDKSAIDTAYKALETVIKSEAKDIRDKYISVPDTTNFGILFLPFEGLYAEIVNHGLVETLQREYCISVAGPSTMAAYLNSLQMGFRTLAIQKRSNQVWEILGGVKTEFEKYQELLKKMQGHLDQTGKDLDLLLGTRTNAVMKKLRSVEALDQSDAAKLLELPQDIE